MTNPPLVSVAIPTYNAPHFLVSTLQSVFAQTFRDYEIVIVNDASTDDTLERLEPYRERVRIITQANGGIGAARNRAIDESRGRYIALLDHDDLWKPEKLAEQVRFLESHPQCVACTVPWASSRQPDRCYFDLERCRDANGEVDRPFQKLAEGEVFMITSAIMFDRQRAAGLRYATQRQCIEDVPFQIGLLTRGRVGIAGDDILMTYREHEANYSSQAAFFYNGRTLLRELDRSGAFAGLSQVDREDLREYLAHIGRTAAVRQLLGGSRGRALAAYMNEATEQILLRRWKFALTFPLLLAMPQSLIKSRWHQSGRIT